MKDIISTEALINKFTDMANRETLLIGSKVTQQDLLMQIIGTIHVVSEEAEDDGMDYDEAVKFCDEHECNECRVYNEEIEVRTAHEKHVQHVPCCINLMSEKHRNVWKKEHLKEVN